MTRVSATASMGVKLKIFSDFENVSPHISITVEQDLDGPHSNEQLVEEASKLYKLCREYVQNEIEKDIKSAKEGKEGRHTGRKVK